MDYTDLSTEIGDKMDGLLELRVTESELLMIYGALHHHLMQMGIWNKQMKEREDNNSLIAANEQKINEQWELINKMNIILDDNMVAV